MDDAAELALERQWDALLMWTTSLKMTERTATVFVHTDLHAKSLSSSTRTLGGHFLMVWLAAASAVMAETWMATRMEQGQWWLVDGEGQLTDALEEPFAVCEFPVRVETTTEREWSVPVQVQTPVEVRVMEDVLEMMFATSGGPFSCGLSACPCSVEVGTCNARQDTRRDRSRRLHAEHRRLDLENRRNSTDSE